MIVWSYQGQGLVEYLKNIGLEMVNSDWLISIIGPLKYLRLAKRYFWVVLAK